VILLIPVYFVGQKFFRSVDDGKQVVEKQRVKAYEKRQGYIIEGHKMLKVNDFYQARWFFKKAAEIDPNDYLLQLGLTRTYINLCKYYDVDCGKAAKSLQALKAEYGDQPGIEKVTNEFVEIQNY
jgi:Tfp pilus assembly protein PilF